MNTQSQKMINEAYRCPLTNKRVNVQIKQITTQRANGRNYNRRFICREPEVCSNIGECGCRVVKIIYGMSYTVDWKKCSLYSTITEQ